MMRFLSFFVLMFFIAFSSVQGQTAWYNSAQSRIDTLRKGNFTVRIVDNLGNPVVDSVKVIHKKHEFSWGAAYDLSSGSNNGTTNVGSASGSITSAYGDAAVYSSERWGKYVAYDLPAVAGSDYKLTLKLAEIYFTAANSRLFDVYVDGTRVIQNLDKFALAGGKNIAFDTILDVRATSNKIKVEFNAIKDNASINGLALVEVNGSSSLYLKSGSGVTINGRVYKADNSYINTSAATLLSTENDWFKSVLLKYTNSGVCGNQFKWSGIEPSGANILNYAPFDYTFNWYTSVGFEMRAHTLLWGGNNSTDYHCIPQWVMNLSSNPKAMYEACKKRVVREVTRYKGRIKEYDVLNEPTHANYLQKIVGDSINWNCFKWAHEVDPDARLYVNDYNIIEYQDQTNNFVALVKKMLQNGAPVSGIGAQCHIGSSVDLTNFKTRFDQLGQFGLPVKITEFDMGAKSLTEKQYAIEISKMMRLAFSHPSIQGFVFWGITEPTWVPESISNLIREDKTVKLAADSLYHLTHEVWTTKLSGKTDNSGIYPFKGYYGDYEVLVKENGKWKKHDISCLKSEKGKSFDLVIGTGKAPSPKLIKVKNVAPNQIFLTFDQKMTDPSQEVKNFKIFDSKLNYFASATLKSDDSTTIVLTTGSLIGEKDYLPVSYLSGNLKSADGGILEVFGATTDATVVPSFVSSKTSKTGKAVSILFDRKLVDTTAHASDFIVKVNNIVYPITASRLSASKDSVVVTLGTQITKSTDVVKVSYLAGSLLTSDKLFVTSFVNNNVANDLLVPKLLSAKTDSPGKSIQVSFDQNLAISGGESSNFKVTSNNKNIAVTDVVISTDYKKILVTLTKAVPKGETVNISYLPGSLSSKTGVQVPAFSTVVTNNSTVTAANEIDIPQANIYPNPFTKQLYIEHSEQFESFSICDMLGKILVEEKLNKNETAVINTESLKNGMYFLKVSNGQESKVFKIVKQNTKP
jgi:uncharacterized repeat protein (TIGR02059 family)